MHEKELADLADKTLLLTENDAVLSSTLARALAARGFSVRVKASLAESLSAIKSSAPAFALVDLKLDDGNGLDVVKALTGKRADARAVVLTGYGNTDLAVTAVKAGAVNFLIKPADINDIVAALLGHPTQSQQTAKVISADRIWWEYIMRIHEASDRNVSASARLLGMHRRTLQRILSRAPPA